MNWVVTLAAPPVTNGQHEIKVEKVNINDFLLQWPYVVHWWQGAPKCHNWIASLFSVYWNHLWCKQSHILNMMSDNFFSLLFSFNRHSRTLKTFTSPWHIRFSLSCMPIWKPIGHLVHTTNLSPRRSASEVKWEEPFGSLLCEGWVDNPLARNSHD